MSLTESKMVSLKDRLVAEEVKIEKKVEKREKKEVKGKK